ncbi:hypothetical protein ACR79Q_21130 [Sphingobacterium multivorum]|uniref:pirin family protein n=1 Tax=Sphingobacterium multivorum TaxID=28454 RepID=UPI003DA23643
MQQMIYRENDRGHVDFGWLKSAHSFSFGQYLDPERMSFGALRVLNDDQVEGGQGFDRHDHKSYLQLDKHNKFVTIVSPDKADHNAVQIHQDAYFNLADIEAGKKIEYTVHSEQNGLYLFVLEGKIAVANEMLSRRDAIGLYETEKISIEAYYDASLLLIEVPMY